MRHGVLSVVVLGALLVQPHAARAAAPEQKAWKVDGVDRHALVFAPTKPGGESVPLVFVFHGAGDTAANFSSVGFQDAWPEAAVIYMDGLGRAPGAGGAFQTTDASVANRDLKFFDAALAGLRQQFRVDSTRIYATGFSNGAKFVYLLWATRPQIFAAFAPVAGMLTAPVPLKEPKPMIHIGGRQDHQNEFDLQLRSIELAKATNGAGKSEACGTICTLYASTKGAPVMTVLHAGGHIYPPGATQIIVKFFREHTAS